MIFCLSSELLDFLLLLHRFERCAFLIGSFALYSHRYDVDSLRRCHNNLTRDTRCVCVHLCMSERERESDRGRDRERSERGNEEIAPGN